MGCSARIRRTEDAEIWPASPALVTSAASSGPLQRADRCPFQLADPPRPPGPGQVVEPVQAAGGEPAPPLAYRVHSDVQVRGDAGAGPAAGGGQHALRPQP